MTKLERKLQDRLNRIEKLFPGKHRIWDLDRIADEFAIEAAYETDDETRKTIYEQALILSRLAWDLMEIRDVIRGNPRKEGPLSKNDPANWPRGPRP